MFNSNSQKKLSILYEDDDLIAMNKPHGLAVHRSKMVGDATEFALQMLRDQVGYSVFPAHRLDRKTGGILLFAKHKEAHRAIAMMFQEGLVTKTYHAIVRGHLKKKEDVIDYPLTHESKTKDAVTYYRVMSEYELPIQSERYASNRYSLVEINPKTGRFHQIRKHFNHLRHPIIGDRPHGCSKQNRLWKKHFNLTQMMLTATTLSFDWKEQNIIIQAPYLQAFQDGMTILETNQVNKAVFL